MPRRIGLSPLQRRFVDEYLVDLNATQAAIRAGYSTKNANKIGPELLGKTRLAEAIRIAQQERSQRTEITQDRVLKEIARLAYADIRKYFTTDGRLKPLHELDDDTAAALSRVEVFEEWEGHGEERESVGMTKKIWTWDKPKNLELLGRHLGLFVDKHEVSGKDGKELPPLQIILTQKTP